MSDLKEVVFQGLGEASMCWSEIPKGIFDSVNAKRIGNEVMQAINEHEKQLYEDVKALHSALNEFLPLFILGNGTDYAGIDEAIEALQRHPELPITVALAEMKRK